MKSSQRRFTVLLGLLAVPALTSCATIDRGLYETSTALAPTHPVYGTPVLNVIPVEQEVSQAQRAWASIEAAAKRDGIAVDPPGERADRLRAVFEDLVSVAHRQSLPWEVHLVGAPDVNALTFGGGVVVVFDGLYGGLVAPYSDEELAAVIAHEIAHVTLLHVPTRQTWNTFGSLAVKEARGDYYRAAYSTAQEAEADRISVLYMALAGYDPMAASRVWERAHRNSGSSAAKYGYLHDHPVNARRMATTQEAAARVARYWHEGEQNPDWKTILERNTLYVRAEEPEYEPGVGLVRAVGAAADTWLKHEQASRERKRREHMAAAVRAVQIVRAWEQPTSGGQVAVFFDVYNGTGSVISELTVDLHYLNGQALLGTDSSCRLAVSIPPQQTTTLGCAKRGVYGATGVQPQITDVAWR